MMRRLLSFMLPLSLVSVLGGCSGEDIEPETAGHAISFNVKLVTDDNGEPVITSIVTVMGPTPPGTGVMAPAWPSNAS